RPGLPERLFRTARRAAARHRRQVLSLSRCRLHLGGSRHHLRPAFDRSPDRPFARRPAHRGADHRSLSGGPHDDRLCGVAGTGVRRLYPSPALAVCQRHKFETARSMTSSAWPLSTALTMNSVKPLAISAVIAGGITSSARLTTASTSTGPLWVS